MGAQAKLPDYSTVDFFYDDEGACALTVRINNAQFHVIVDQSKLESKNGSRRQYKKLLDNLKKAEAETEEEQEEREAQIDGTPTETSASQDSGVDVSTPKQGGDETDPAAQLQEWILKPMADAIQEKASDSERPKGQTVQDFYYTPTYFYELESKDSKINANEITNDDELTDRIKGLLPDLPVPKYIQNFNIPVYPASELIVLADSASPEPIHPTAVKLKDQMLFLKLVDRHQLQSTKREIRLMKEIEQKGIHKQIQMPLIRGLVRFDEAGENNVIGFLMDAIEDAQPLTWMLDTEVPQEKRERWAEEARKMVDVLHDNGIVWGDAKGDNFMVDKHDVLWIIDFGGSYTEGWIDPELRDTEEGDEMGVNKLVNALHDPEANTFDDGDPAETRRVSEMSAQGVKRKHTEVEDDDARDDAGETEDGAKASKQRKTDDTDAASGEENYCVCGGTESGDMVACDGKDCKKKWFHFSCVGLDEAPSTKEWFCEECSE